MSTLCSVIAGVWDAYVWDTASLRSITSRFYPFDPTSSSEFEIANLMYDREINFFSYLITKTERYIGTNVLQEDFEVVVTYTRAKDTNGDTWTATRDAIETVINQVRTALGDTWQARVSFYAPQEEPYNIEESIIQNVPVWRARYTFTAKI